MVVVVVVWLWFSSIVLNIDGFFTRGYRLRCLWGVFVSSSRVLLVLASLTGRILMLGRCGFVWLYFFTSFWWSPSSYISLPLSGSDRAVVGHCSQTLTGVAYIGLSNKSLTQGVMHGTNAFMVVRVWQQLRRQICRRDYGLISSSPPHAPSLSTRIRLPSLSKSTPLTFRSTEL